VAECLADDLLGAMDNVLCCAGNEAAEVYIQLSDVHTKLESSHESASSFAEAANCFKKVSKPGAKPPTISCLAHQTSPF
jgi:hypothetical protein